MRTVALAVALGVLALSACGSEPQGVTVTEAPPDEALAPRAPRPSAAFDTVYADSGLFADPARDSLAADSLAPDSLTADSAASAPAAPDFRAFWPRFQTALQTGRPEVETLALLGEGGLPRARFESVWERALADGPFRDGVLALTARDFRRVGPAREASVVVGYDAGGRIVRQDEAVRDSTLVLRFEPVEGAYRLVRLAVTG
jgi:hypothetical protein